MRKLTAMALSMMFILGSIIPVGAEETQTRQSTISVSIDPVYTVTIPANTTIERGEQSVKLGSVSLDNARLEPDKNVNVSVSASGKLKNSKDESKTIAYKIMDGNKEFSTALNTSRVEDAGVNIPKLLEVAVTDGKWSITSEYVEGPTLTQLIEKYPDKADDYIKKMVEYQISFQKKSNPLLLVLKDKMNRQINSIEELDNSVKYELLTRLNSMKNHTKLCHGDYCPDNIIVTADAKGNIKEITAVDWVHATQGNASADIANTFLLLKLQFGDKSDIPEKYISAFCELTNTKRSYVNEWLPLVAAARLTKNKEEEKELLNQWINVVDFQ